MGQFQDSLRIAQRAVSAVTADGYEGGQPEQLFAQPNTDTVNALIQAYLDTTDFTKYVTPIAAAQIVAPPSQSMSSLDVLGNITMQGQRQVYYNGIGSPGGILGSDIRFDTITGAGGAGSGNIAPGTITGYNLADYAIPFSKLTGTAQAQVIAFTTQDTSFSMLRSVSTSGTSLDSNGKETDGLTISNGATRVADGQAYRGFAITNTGMSSTGVTAVSGPAYAGLAAGMYVATVFVRATTTSNTSTALTLQVTGTAITSSTVTLAASDLATTYVGIAVPFTVTAATNTFNIQITNNLLPATVNWLFSHVRVQQNDGKATAGAVTFFFANASITSAQIQSITATQITAGTINSDDIFVGTGGHIYAGNKTGGRVEFNSAGISAFQTVNLLSVANQSFESGVGSWVGSASGYTTATLAVSTAQKYVGAQSLLVTWPTASAGLSSANINATGLTIGTTYTVSAYVYVPSGSPAVRMCDLFAGSTFVAGNIATATNNAWVRVYYTFTAVGTSHFFGIVNNTASTSGQTCYMDAAQLEVGTFTTYTANTSAAATSFTLANNGIMTLTNASGSVIALDPNKGLNFYNSAGVSNLFLDITTGAATFSGNVTGATITGSSLTVGTAGSTSILNTSGNIWFGAVKPKGIIQSATVVSAVGATTGGSMAARTYNYVIFAFDSNGLRGDPSYFPQVTTTGTTSKVTLTWTNTVASDPNSEYEAIASYRVYRNTTIDSTYYLVGSGIATSATTFVDTTGLTGLGSSTGVFYNETAATLYMDNGIGRTLTIAGASTAVKSNLIVGGTISANGGLIANYIDVSSAGVSTLTLNGNPVVSAPSGGTKTQTGTFTVTFAAGVATATVNFANSTTFAGAPVVVVSINAITGNTTATINITGTSTTGFSYRAQQQATGTAYAGTVTGWYFAIG